MDVTALIKACDHDMVEDAEGLVVFADDFAVAGRPEVAVSPRPPLPPLASSNVHATSLQTAGEGAAEGSTEEEIEGLGETERKRAKRKRERDRKKARLDESYGKGAVRRAAFVKRSLEVAHSDFLVSSTAHCANGYTGLPDRGLAFADRSSSDLTRLEYLRDVGGYRLADTTADASVDYPFVDRAGKVWAVALKEPKGWDERRKGINAARARLVNRLEGYKCPSNRRGDFQSYRAGFSFGGGQKKPMNVANSPAVAAALLEFYTDEHVAAMFKYAEGGLETWFPKHRASFQSAIKGITSLHPELRQAVPGTSFAASTFNVGPRVICRAHRDVGNVAPAICLDYVDGPFDRDAGGHIVLHEALRIVKLRPGGILLFPSAAVTHETTPIALDEVRFSITAYLAGLIQCYLDAGGRTLKEWVKVDREEAGRHEEGGTARWDEGCKKFMTSAELITYWESRSKETPPLCVD